MVFSLAGLAWRRPVESEPVSQLQLPYPSLWSREPGAGKIRPAIDCDRDTDPGGMGGLCGSAEPPGLALDLSCLRPYTSLSVIIIQPKP